MTRTRNDDESWTSRYRACEVTLCVILCLALSGCGGGSGSVPTAPSSTRSFLEGTWRGTVSIAPRMGAQDPLPTTTVATTWIFEPVVDVPQLFRATVRFNHPWLTFDVLATTGITPDANAPGDIFTSGTYRSPRGCQGSFSSDGRTTATTIDASFDGLETDCELWGFTGRVLLEKQ